jgi:hypothetical protein
MRSISTKPLENQTTYSPGLTAEPRGVSSPENYHKHTLTGIIISKTWPLLSKTGISKYDTGTPNTAHRFCFPNTAWIFFALTDYECNIPLTQKC